MPRYDQAIKWIKNEDHTLSPQIDVNPVKRGPKKILSNYKKFTPNNEVNYEKNEQRIQSADLETQQKQMGKKYIKPALSESVALSGVKRKREQAAERDQQLLKKPHLDSESQMDNNIELAEHNDDDPIKKKRNKRRKRKNSHSNQNTEKQIDNEDNNCNDINNADKVEDSFITDEDYFVDPNVEEELPTSKDGIKAFDLIQQAKKEENVMKYNKLISMVRIKSFTNIFY